jgi:hypothetical protein
LKQSGHVAVLAVGVSAIGLAVRLPVERFAIALAVKRVAIATLRR